MFLVRDIVYCKPGKVRPMVEKFLALAKLGEKMRTREPMQIKEFQEAMYGYHDRIDHGVERFNNWSTNLVAASDVTAEPS